MEYTNLSIREWLTSKNPSSVDILVIKRRVDFIKSEIDFLEKQVLSRNISEVSLSPIFKRLLERSYQLVIEAIINICRHIVSTKGWGTACTSKDFISKCIEHGVIPKVLGEKLIRHIAMRSIIVHRYLDIDYKKLYIEARELAIITREFEKNITNFLRKSASNRKNITSQQEDQLLFYM